MNRELKMSENEYDCNKMDGDSFEYSHVDSEREKGRIGIIPSLEN